MLLLESVQAGDRVYRPLIASNVMPPHTCFSRNLVAKNFAITIFIWGSLWVETLFFLLLFDRSCRFPRCSNSKLSLSIPSVVQSKKVGRDMNTSADDLTLHAKPLHWVPVISSPKPFLHQLSRSNRSSLKIAGQDAHYGITSQYHWVSKKAPKRASKLHAQGRSGPQRSKKKSHGLRRWRAGPRARTPSSSTSAAAFTIAGAHPALRFFPPPFTVV